MGSFKERRQKRREERQLRRHGGLGNEAEVKAEDLAEAGVEAETEGAVEEAVAEAGAEAEAEVKAEEAVAEAGTEAGTEVKAEESESDGEKAEIESEVEKAEDVEAEAASAEEPQEEQKERLVRGMAKTRKGIFGNLKNIFRGFSKIDDDFYEEIEEILVMSDIGVHATEEIIENLKVKVKENRIKEPEAVREFLIDSIKEQMRVEETAYRFEDEKSVVMVIGVNGVGKTTTIGKLAAKLKGQGKKVILAAADTFRAAAGEQLAEWARRAGVELIGGQEGADPGSVVFDAVAAAKARNADVLICDTAGRLHNKKNLMEELKKLDRIITRELPDAHRETLVVLDATTGQNGLVQAKEFSEVAPITGIVLTKMDGTAKGGIAVAIQSELHVPVKYIGVGETVADLQKFNSDEFVDAIFTE